ncbi:extracellular solute-binding protein [Leifsonia sp. PS1209]|uniref:extracellular solute-binding protein n=1 Tax=Leifsonia sp. PS1209 TaxID=2724914 RepID=UPI001442D62D|nr:extracellular solute-binding protein [Leifsonia sp. PS1209]QIZ97638.1 extracellular solute-binding protein [Leifsonia sp. PS1209]
MRYKKMITATAVAATAAIALAGCSGGSGESDTSKKTVTMWIYPVIADEKAHKTFWDSTIKAFEAEHKNITVKYEIYPWANRDESLATAIAAGKGPDLVYLIPDQLSTYQKSIEPMDAYLPSAQKKDILDNVTKSITIDGKLMGAPILTSANALMCDAKAFDAAGITEYPKTWDDLEALAPKFKEKGIYVTNYFGSPDVTLNMTFYPLLWQAGGSVYNKDGSKVAFDSAAGEKALSLISGFAKDGYIEKDLISTMPSLEQTALASNKVACTWQSGPADVTSFWGEDAIKILPPLTDKESVSYGTVGSLAMLKGATSKDAAGEFAAYATDAENSKKFDLASNFFSPLKSTGELYADDPIQSAIEKTIPTSRVGELQPSARAVMGVLAPEIQAALLGTKTPKQALKDAAAAAQPLIK